MTALSIGLFEKLNRSRRALLRMSAASGHERKLSRCVLVICPSWGLVAPGCPAKFEKYFGCPFFLNPPNHL